MYTVSISWPNGVGISPALRLAIPLVIWTTILCWIKHCLRKIASFEEEYNPCSRWYKITIWKKLPPVKITRKSRISVKTRILQSLKSARNHSNSRVAKIKRFSKINWGKKIQRYLLRSLSGTNRSILSTWIFRMIKKQAGNDWAANSMLALSHTI